MIDEDPPYIRPFVVLIFLLMDCSFFDPGAVIAAKGTHAFEQTVGVRIFSIPKVRIAIDWCEGQSPYGGIGAEFTFLDVSR